jgi:hypothetical protein
LNDEWLGGLQSCQRQQQGGEKSDEGFHDIETTSRFRGLGSSEAEDGATAGADADG